MWIYCWSSLKSNTHLVHRGGLLDYFECKSGFPKFINRNVQRRWNRGANIELITELILSIPLCLAYCYFVRDPQLGITYTLDIKRRLSVHAKSSSSKRIMHLQRSVISQGLNKNILDIGPASMYFVFLNSWERMLLWYLCFFIYFQL